MYISKININNFKCFTSQEISFNRPNNLPGSGLNILIGENNCGKSTIFEAINFLRNGTDKDVVNLKNKITGDKDNLYIEITFAGNIPDTIEDFSQENKKKIFQKYLFDENSTSQIKFVRSSEDIKTIKLWDNENRQYNNESGIDAPIKKLFEFNFVWADTNPNDQFKFGATTLSGNLLKRIMNQFEETEEFERFSHQFNEAFNHPNSAVKKQLYEIEEKTQKIFTEQFGNATISFHFDDLKIDTFFKNSSIRIDDGIETPLLEKGSGMQRALALALLQVYADGIIKHPEKDAVKPFFLFIDEPEICLHPKAQVMLFKALIELSKSKQIFLATHSPYFFKSEFIKNMALFICKKNANNQFNVEQINNDDWGVFPWSPSWGEINYYAYNMPTIEFHNELYGQLQYKSESKYTNELDKYIKSKGLITTRKWQKESKGNQKSEEDVSLQTFIRNKIHHPENQIMFDSNFTEQELEQSIDQMIELLSQNGESKDCEKEEKNPITALNIDNSLNKDLTKISIKHK